MAWPCIKVNSLVNITFCCKCLKFSKLIIFLNDGLTFLCVSTLERKKNKQDGYQTHKTTDHTALDNFLVFCFRNAWIPFFQLNTKWITCYLNMQEYFYECYFTSTCNSSGITNKCGKEKTDKTHPNKSINSVSDQGYWCWYYVQHSLYVVQH